MNVTPRVFRWRHPASVIVKGAAHDLDVNIPLRGQDCDVDPDRELSVDDRFVTVIVRLQ